MIRTRRLSGAGAAACAAALALPVAGHAATSTVTNDAGQAAPITPGLQIRNMAPTISTAFAANETYYRISYTFTPAGGSATPLDDYSNRTCSAVPTPRTVDNAIPYRGNGIYAVSVQTTTGAKDYDCANLGAASGGSFTIAAGTAINALPPTFLIRKKGTTDYNDFSLSTDYNPGAQFGDIQIVKGPPTYNPDGSILSPTVNTSVTATAPILTRKFFDPGDYTFVARASRSGIGTAWTPPVRVRMQDPFDFYTAPYFTDSRGPSYKITGRTIGTRPSGKVTVLAKRRGAKKFRKLGSGRIRSTRRFGVRFKLKTTGRYQLKFTYKGSSFMQAGSVTYKGYRFRKRVIFR